MMIRRTADLTAVQQAFPYPRLGSKSITDLGRRIVAEIDQNGPLSFQKYMTRCLYDEEFGYYSRTDEKIVSRDGDFITSVSVGPVFGILLARRLHRVWKANDSPGIFEILELGGHDGTLAKDILEAARQFDPSFFEALKYHLHEPHPARQDLISSKLGNQVNVLESLNEVRSPLGAVIANEVLDALPVPLFLRSQDAWHEVSVTHQDGILDWDTRQSDFDPEGDFPDGYVMEGLPDLGEFLNPIAEVFQRGLFIFIDYGFDEGTLRHPSRTAGTVRSFRNHRSNAHPLDFPGEQDITSDVNFTAVENHARDLDLRTRSNMNQGRYLTHCGKDWLLSGPNPTEVAQFQTLIHPSQFGGRFHVMELTKGDVSIAHPSDPV